MRVRTKSFRGKVLRDRSEGRRAVDDRPSNRAPSSIDRGGIADPFGEGTQRRSGRSTSGWIACLAVVVGSLSMGCGTLNEGQSYLVTDGPLLGIAQVATVNRLDYPLRVEFARISSVMESWRGFATGEREMLRMLDRSRIWTGVARAEDAEAGLEGAKLTVMLEKVANMDSFGRRLGLWSRRVATLGFMGYPITDTYRVEILYKAPDHELFQNGREWKVFSYKGMFIEEPEEYDGSNEAKFGSARKAEAAIVRQVVFKLIDDLKKEGMI